MVKRTVILPVKKQAVGNDPAVYDLFGVKGVEITRIRVDYRDVVKAVVEGDEKNVAELQERSREHFARIWPARTEGSTDEG